MNDEELKAWVEREVAKAPPFNPKQAAAIASAFRGTHTPELIEKLRRSRS